MDAGAAAAAVAEREGDGAGDGDKETEVVTVMGVGATIVEDKIVALSAVVAGRVERTVVLGTATFAPTLIPTTAVALEGDVLLMEVVDSEASEAGGVVAAVVVEAREAGLVKEAAVVRGEWEGEARPDEMATTEGEEEEMEVAG